MLYPLKGGARECNTCFAPGEFKCPECDGTVYCSECCSRMHKHPQRAAHSPISIKEDNYKDDSMEIQNDYSGCNEEYEFSSSPDTIIMTLAANFQIASFKIYQKQVINAVLKGKDCLVIQPTGSVFSVSSSLSW